MACDGLPAAGGWSSGPYRTRTQKKKMMNNLKLKILERAYAEPGFTVG